MAETVTLNLFDKANARAVGDGCEPVSVAERSVRVFPMGKANFSRRQDSEINSE